VLGSFVVENLCSRPYTVPSLSPKMNSPWTVELRGFEWCNYVNGLRILNLVHRSFVFVVRETAGGCAIKFTINNPR
jgi:hypothetical protein